MLSELYSYSHQTPECSDSFSTKLTLSYLEACNKIFEQGLLSHNKVTSPDCQVVLNIREGYQFFTKWLDELYEGVLHGKYIIDVHLCMCVCQMCTCMYAYYVCDKKIYVVTLFSCR